MQIRLIHSSASERAQTRTTASITPSRIRRVNDRLELCYLQFWHSRARLGAIDVTLHIPDDVAKRLSAAGADLSRRALEAIALEGYREQSLTLLHVRKRLGFLAPRPKISWAGTMFRSR